MTYGEEKTERFPSDSSKKYGATDDDDCEREEEIDPSGMVDGVQALPFLVGEGSGVLVGDDDGVENDKLSNLAPSLGVDKPAGPFLIGTDNGVGGIEKKEASRRGP